MRGDGVRVLIVGAGITGVAAARALRGWGAAVERAAAPMSEGTGIYLPGNAARALTGLGLGRQVAEFAVHIERQRVADHRGRRLFDVETADIWNGEQVRDVDSGPFVTARLEPQWIIGGLMYDAVSGVEKDGGGAAAAVFPLSQPRNVERSCSTSNP